MRDTVYVNRSPTAGEPASPFRSRLLGLLNDPLRPGGSPSAIAPDDAGGGYLAWYGFPWPVLRLQHVQASLATAPAWADTGVVLSFNTGTPYWTSDIGPMQSDGSGGVYVSWIEGCARVQRFTSAGGIAPGWPAAGLPIHPGAGALPPHQVAGDGQGGAYVAWRGTVPYATRVLAGGSFAPGWPAAGRALTDPAAAVPPGDPHYRIATGAAGGLLVAWDDSRYAGAGNVRLRWLLGDGTSDPATPDTGVVIAPADTLNASLSGLLADGIGGAFLTRSTYFYDPFARIQTQAWLHRVVYPAVAAVAPQPRAATPELAPVRPNPATDALTVRFTLPHDGAARLELYDVGGRRLRAVDASGAGEHTARFAGLEALPPGLYLVRLSQAGTSRTERVTLLH